MSDFKVGCSPVSSIIYAGSVLKNGTWGKNKQDVTETAVGAVAQHLMQLGRSVQFKHINGKRYMLQVVEIAEPAKLDVDNEDYYDIENPAFMARTRSRLKEIAECGMVETGIASFGYPGIMSGLYIEKVWNYSDEEFKSYMDWAKDLIKKKLGENEESKTGS